MDFDLYLIYVISRRGKFNKRIIRKAIREIEEKIPGCVAYPERRGKVVLLLVYCPPRFYIGKELVFDVGRRINELRKILDGEARGREPRAGQRSQRRGRRSRGT